MSDLERQMRFERSMRHASAASNSDYLHLKQCLLDASQRFSDVADQIESGNGNPVPFMRASAARYKAEAETH